jgi:hypothetical protein
MLRVACRTLQRRCNRRCNDVLCGPH